MTESRLDLSTVLSTRQPALDSARVAAASGALLRYRVMAIVTGVILLSGTIALIVKYTADSKLGGWYAILWVAHGWLFLVYLVITGMLAVRLRWPLGRLVLVALAGTIPTMSFVAEHFVTKAAKSASSR